MLKLDNVTKTFGTFKALDCLSLSVPKGAVYGLVRSEEHTSKLQSQR